MKIMIVDNDPAYLGLLSEVLRLHGYQVTAAHNGEEALSKLRESTVDFILSDISMPKMNGINLHRYIRQDPRLKHLPFAWNSGYRELREVAEADDPTIDLKFDKAMTMPNLLFFLDHFAALRKKRSGEQEAVPC